jgi:hypothetical protein
MPRPISPILNEAQKSELVATLRRADPTYTLPYAFFEHLGELVVCRIPTAEQARAFASSRGTKPSAIALFNDTVAHPAGEELRRLMRAKPVLAYTIGMHLARESSIPDLVSPALSGESLEALLQRLRQAPDEEMHVLELDGEQAVCRAPTEGEVLRWASLEGGEGPNAEKVFEWCVRHPTPELRERLLLYKPFSGMAFGIQLLRRAGLGLEAEKKELRSS